MKPLDVKLRLPLDHCDLDVEFRATRAITGVFGPSGAGKSSLLEAVAGMRSEAQGRVLLGECVWLDTATGIDLAPEHRGLGYVPQDGLLFPHLDVRGNLLAGSRRRAPGTMSLESVAGLLSIGGLMERSVTSLSGGERQRVALARALCSGPDLLLLDEPLAALELPLRRRLLTLLRRLRADLTVPMLFISHDPIEIQALCDEVLVLEQGRLVASGPPARVLSAPHRAISGHEVFTNVLTGHVLGATAGSARVRLGAGGPEVIVAPSRAAAGQVLLELPADRILIATESPLGLSARNVLSANVQRIRDGSGVSWVDVLLQPGSTRLVVEVTESTPARLGLETGRDVHLVIKATSFRLHA